MKHDPPDKYEKESEERIAEDDSKDYPKIKPLNSSLFVLHSSLNFMLQPRKPLPACKRSRLCNRASHQVPCKEQRNRSSPYPKPYH